MRKIGTRAEPCFMRCFLIRYWLMSCAASRPMKDCQLYES
jgi:hypothetical protein